MGGRCAQDIAGAVIPVNGSGCPLRRRVVQRIRDVRQVNITVAVSHHHFGGDRIMTHNTVASISVNGCARGKIQMQFFSIPVEDGFRDADLTVRDGLRQDAARDTNLIYQ